MNQERQISTLPPVIRKEIEGHALSMYRIRKDGGGEDYHLAGNHAVFLVLSAWQYHVLSALFAYGGDRYETLLGNVNDRFGLDLKRADVDALFNDIRQK